MFGKKQRRIEELEQKVDGFESILPYVPLAEEIHRRLDAFSDEVEASGNPAAYVDSLVPTMTEEGRVTYLRDIFQRMPFHEQLEVLHRYYDDDATVRELLSVQRRELIAQQASIADEESAKRLTEELRKSAAEYGVVDLGKVASGNIVELDLLYMHGDTSKLDTFKTARLMGRSMSEPGKIHVLRHGNYHPAGLASDYYIPQNKRGYIAPHQVAKIGTTITDGKEETYEPTLFKDIADPHIEVGGRRLTVMSQFKLVRLAINNSVIFD